MARTLNSANATTRLFDAPSTKFIWRSSGMTKRARRSVGALLAVGVCWACGQAPPSETAAQPDAASAKGEAAKGSHAFRGTVEAVDPAAKTLQVHNEFIEGWMAPMSMVYSADRDGVYATVKAGDQITATVYDGDFKTLYNVQVVRGDAAPAAGQ
jgi:Cu/Ag efflux protein CusF